MLKAVLFDLDDTLIDWSKFTVGWDGMEARHLQNVFDYLVSLHPLSDIKVFNTEYARRVQDAWAEARSSLRAPHLGRLLVDTAVSVGVPIHLVDMQRCLEFYAWRAVQETSVFPDAIDVLKQLQARGLKMGIITNSFHPAALRDVELDEHGLLEFFPDCRITAADAGYLKPHPEIFELALRKLDVTADETVFVGDNAVADIAGAQGAGMRAILRRKVDRLPVTSGLVVPDATITSLLELLPILDEWFPPKNDHGIANDPSQEAHI
jgi:HAD superfamily hydrolase (TIGR01662 family)